MIPKNYEDKLIRIYFYICEKYKQNLKYTCERFSNNAEPEFTDEEIMTIYIFVMHHQKHSEIKAIHQFAIDYLIDWFPKLPSYQAFSNRINRLPSAFAELANHLILEFIPEDSNLNLSLLDSMPIITCSGKRAGKVAREITDKGYNSTKGFYYYGLKLHALAYSRVGRLPHPEQITLTAASVNDFSLFIQQQWGEIPDRTFLGDKAYHNKAFFDKMKAQFNSEMLTPVKGVKGMPENIKNFNKAADDLFSKAVSKVRQPIEAFFNWLIVKTKIQNAGKVRSTKGLLVHVYGRLAVAFINFMI